MLHRVLGTQITPPFPEQMKQIIFGMGCFWGAQKLFWETRGVYTTSVGYSGGSTLNPTYRDVCSGRTGHAEVVRVVYDPSVVSLINLLAVFWEGHDPTTLNQQGNDRGTQYRSCIFCTSQQDLQLARASAEFYQKELKRGQITTQIDLAQQYYYAQEYHQQYSQTVLFGYCGLQKTGVKFSVESFMKGC